jgi:spore coat protein U-like protein
MTVIAGCSNLTATSLAFPITVAAGSSQIPTATGSVTATCSSGVTALLGFNAGANVSGTVTVPVLKGPGTTGSQTIAYGIYSDSAFGTPFPAVTAPTTTPAGGTTITGGAAFPVTVYGQIGANTAGATVSPTIAAGAYTDTLTATIYF